MMSLYVTCEIQLLRLRPGYVPLKHLRLGWRCTTWLTCHHDIMVTCTQIIRNVQCKKRTYKRRCLNEAIPTFLAYAYMILWSNIECRVYMSIGIVLYHVTCTYPNSRYSLLETSNSLSQCFFNITHMLTVTTWSKHLEFGGFLSMEATNVQPRHTRDCLSSISTQESTMFFTSTEKK